MRVAEVLGAVALLALGACSSGSGSAGPSEDAGGRADEGVGPGGDASTGEDAGGGADAASERGNGKDGKDAGADAPEDAPVDALPDGGCFVTTVGVYGECISTTACAALGDHTSDPGYCPGSASIECCTLSPNVANNPPVPVGWELMQQAEVTTAMTDWAVMILDAPTQYPMFSTTMMTFGSLLVMARVEWHPPDFQNGVVHRGVTLYQQTD